MIKPKFTIRTMMIATLLVAVLLPTAIAYYDDVVAYFNPARQRTPQEIIEEEYINADTGPGKKLQITFPQKLGF